MDALCGKKPPSPLVDYSLQAAQQSAIRALCLVTHDISPGLIRYRRQQSMYYYDRDLVGDVNIRW
jgi:hypothetical protein